MTLYYILAGFSALALLALATISFLHKKAGFKVVLGLFFFGMLMSVPFIMMEFTTGYLDYYYIAAAFILIELAILFFERHVHFFHELIHHNIKELRIISFLLIGFGFTYAEISLSILHSSGDMTELINTLPFKTTYALLMHTVFASAASLVKIGGELAGDLIASLIKAAVYYLRIAIISVSHYLYVFSVENNMMPLIAAILAVGLVSFFYIQDRLEAKPGSIS